MSCLDRGSLCPDLAASVYGSPEHSRQESLSYLFLGVFDLVYTGEWGVCVCLSGSLAEGDEEARI